MDSDSSESDSRLESLPRKARKRTMTKNTRNYGRKTRNLQIKMDRWESSIEDFQKSQTLATFSSVLHTAESVLKEDLAPFELDWFVQTLLSEPVLLLDTISARVSDDAWSKVVKDSYKILSDIVENHYDAVHQYIDSIISECQKPHDARTRSHALQCLTCCIKRTLPGGLASQYITELAQATTCKAPLAVLVGTICEFHPEAVEDQIHTIWRTYLNLLASNKNTDLVCKSLLQGVWGLLKHFGADLPVTELGDFYDKLSRDYIRKAQNAALSIVRDYAPLFKERLARDAAFRLQLWTFEDLAPVLPVYEHAGAVLTEQQLQKIFLTEIAPKTTESYAKLKFTALRVCVMLQKLYGVSVDGVLNVDAYSLEFELRKETSYDVAEAVSWCIESQMVNSEKLLQTAILYYHNLPASKKKDIVVNGLLNAPVDIMNATLNFLTAESCYDNSSLHTYLPLWRDLLESPLIDKKKVLFHKYMDNVLLVVDNFLEECDDKKLPDKLASLLTLTSHVLTLHSVEDYTSDQCAVLAPKLVELAQECGLEACMVAVARSMTPHLDGCINEIFEMISIDKCKDEALLCECSLALAQAPVHATQPDVLLKALEIIFSRKDAEPKTMCSAIHKLEQLIVKQNNNLNNLSKIVQLIEKLRLRKDLIGKDARVLQRDVTIFLGKYSNLSYANDVAQSDDNDLIIKLKDVLILDLPNPIEGTTYKLSLHRMLHLALTQQDEGSLRMLVNIICANLCSNSTSVLQAALGRATAALCRARAGDTRHVARHAAASFCGVDATLYIMRQISVESSPGVRRMLADSIEGILLREPGSEANEKLLKAVYSELCDMMNNSSVIKLAALDITESVLSALKINRHQTKNMLPSLIILITRTFEQNSSTVFEIASQLYIDSIGLFDTSVLDSTVTELLKILLNPDQKITRVTSKIYKNILKSSLQFIKNITENDISKIIRVILDMRVNSDSVKFVYLWSVMSKIFDFDEAVMCEVLEFENCVLLDGVFNEIDMENVFEVEANLSFINQYSAVLYKNHSVVTIKHISGIIEKMPLKHVKSHRRHLSECLTHCRRICQNTPDMVLKSLESWSESLPIKNITEHIDKEKFLTEHTLYINSLDIMLEIFNLKDPTIILTTVSIFAKTWPRMLLKLFASGHVKYLKKETPFLSDLLSVSLRFLTVTDVKNILLEGHGLEGAGNYKLGVEFGSFFMSVFLKYLVRKPFVLLQNGMESCCALLNDIVKWSVRKRWHDDQLENLLELVDQLWPIYESRSSFNAKHTLLSDLSCMNIKLSPHSRPMLWAKALVGSDEARREDRIALVTVLPGGDEYSETYRRYAALLPTRLSDMDGAARAALRALLDALAGNADTTLMDIVITLAGGEETAGWWDAACAASLRAHCTRRALLALRTRARAAPVCRRLLVPLLRSTSLSVCEEFFAFILKDTLEGLSTGVRAPSSHPEYSACVEQKTINLEILQVIFEKVPPSKIESPSSSLYEHIQTDKPWYLAREVIRLCYKLRDKLVAPEGATAALSRLCREFQYSAYKCMCACVCVRRPDAHIYKTVFSVSVWNKIVDESFVYDLPLVTEWNRHKIRKSVSINVTGGGQRARGASRTRSRSRVFLRTLSENPLDYDLIEHQDDDTDPQDVELTDNSLNKHPCAATLTALFQHAAGLDHYEWRAELCEGLKASVRSARWLLAEAVCNCKEELKPHATQLRPGLLAVVADTAQEGFNSLHVDILNTLIYWTGDVSTSELPHLNSAVTYLVLTALNNSARGTIFRMLEGVLENMLRIYGKYIEGNIDVFVTSFDDPNRTRTCSKLLLRFVKNKVRVQNLLQWILTKFTENHGMYKSELSIIAEIIGTEISNSDKQEQVAAAAKLKKILEEMRKSSVSDYVKVLYYSGCCDAQQFRTIVDLTQKLPEADKKKCLHIISTYIHEHPDSAEVDEVPANIKQMADMISVDRQFEDIFITKPQFLKPSSYPAKRVKVEISSPILSTIGRNEKHISDVLTRLGKGRGKVEERLCKNNMAVRFLECFYIAIYLPLKYPCNESSDLSVCSSTFFKMLFSHLKNQDTFKEKRLRDEPWVVINPIGLTKSRSKMMVGTLRTFSYTSTRDDNYDESEEIDVQVSIEKILDSLVEFAKVTPDASTELLTQLLRCLAGRGFDPRPGLAQLLAILLTTVPELVVLARECVDHLLDIDGFMETVEELKKSTIGSEGEQLFRLLHEEAKIRCIGNSLFTLGISHEENISMSENAEFTIEGLVTAFQKLSNWDEITLQGRRRVEDNIPALWTDRENFKELLNENTDTKGWFGQMVELYRENGKDVMKWLRFMDRWPRRQYLVSSVVEAMQWRVADIEIDTLLPCDIRMGDCLAEWAARLMLRTAYLNEKSIAGSDRLSRSHELVWCESANERGLHNLALSVIKRNYLDLDDHETLLWMEQKMLAHTAMGFKLNDRSELERALQMATHLPEFYEKSTSEAVVAVNKLLMQLNYKLQSLSTSKIEDIMTVVEERVNRLNKKEVSTSTKYKRNISYLYETAVLYYNEQWDQNEMSNDEILIKMCEYLSRLSEQNRDVASGAAIILNRLDQCSDIHCSTASTLLTKMKPILSKLPSCYVEQLKAKISLFPTHLVRASGITQLQEDKELEKYTRCLQLLCHADYLLLQYCDELYTSLQYNDISKWDKIFKRMNNRIFENEFAGSDFQALTKYKSTFNTLEAADPEMKRIVLKGVIQDLKSRPIRETIRLSHVCPSLARDLSLDLGRLLMLPAGVQVLMIEEELCVYTGSVRRPCVLTVLTTDGRRRRYLHKNEDLRADASVRTVCADAGKYTVIPLSEDCGLIEFLEDHKRIRDMIASTCNIDEVPVRQAAVDTELILASKASSLQNYNEICSKIPARALRSAMEHHSASVQDFIVKKRRFLETLSDMTIINWLFGLGDRHLENIMYSVQDGGLQCIDWGAIYQYSEAELPAARLTRNMLAVCDTTVLESRLQRKLSSLRDTHQLIIPVLKLVFRWMENFSENLFYIESILQGRMVAHQITKDVLQKSNKQHKTKYIQLLDAVFEDHRDKDTYSIVEQVSYLLRQCTDPWILSVTRSGWEPWL